MNIFELKIKLWLAFSSVHPDNLTRNEMDIWGYLEKDEDVILYQAACNNAKEYIDIEEWNKNNSKNENRFSEDRVSRF